jgi:hypothetical protein
MKQLRHTLFALAIFAAVSSMSSCAKCFVCTEKGGDEFAKFEFCDKDFSSGDVRDGIDYYEDLGMTCRAKSRIL